jgi:cytoskeletal protein RodZ
MEHSKTSAPLALALRRQRIRVLRRRVVAVAVTAFVIAWAAIFGQLASGHDPALTHNSQAKTSTKTTKAKTSDSTSGSGSTSSSTSTSGSTSTPQVSTTPAQPQQQPAPVTTRQS